MALLYFDAVNALNDGNIEHTFCPRNQESSVTF